jgi:GT2 family glycosyltransferase
MHYPTVGIGILNWNGKKFLEQFLHFSYALSYPNKKIYVIDNNSSDESVAYLRAFHPQVIIIETGGNYGVAGGYNKGFAQMPEDYLLMLNSDVELQPGLLEPLVQMMEADDAIGIVQSKLLSYYNKQYFEHGGAAGGMMDLLGYSFCRGRIFDTVETDTDQYNNAEIFWAGGACCLVRKKAYEEIGGMYDYLFMHFEEIDMCWRMHAKGYKVKYCKDSVAYHVGGGTLSYQSPVKTYYNFRNNLIMVYRNSTWLYRLWWLPLRLLLDQSAVFNYAFKGEFKNSLAVWKGYGAFFKWMIAVKNKVPGKKSLFNMPGVIKQSIVWKYYILGQRKWSSIINS